MPKLNTNDDSYILVGWLAKDGEPIAAGEPVVEVETSKAVEEIAAPTSGFLFHRVTAGTPITPGQIIGSVEGIQVRPAAAPGTQVTLDAQIITAPARARMAELGIAEEQVKRLTIALVRAADIDTLASARPVPPPGGAAMASITERSGHIGLAGQSGHELSKVQRAVGRAVSRSHATIPAAYTVVKMDVGAAVARAAGLIRQVRRPVGLADLFIEAVAGLHEAFPLFYGHLADDGATVLLADAPHIGVTVDLGEGLYVPVIRDAATKTIGDIARQLMEFRVAAAGGAFRASDLDGANIAVTLHTDVDVVLAIPFIFPGQVCALAVTAPQPELVLDAGGAVTSRTVAHIGLAYDHRVINGRDAALFLDALKNALKEAQR